MKNTVMEIEKKKTKLESKLILITCNYLILIGENFLREIWKEMLKYYL